MLVPGTVLQAILGSGTDESGLSSFEESELTPLQCGGQGRSLTADRLQAQPQAELRLARVECSNRLSEARTGYQIIFHSTVARKLEVCVVEHIECLSLKLQLHLLRKTEVLERGHIHIR